VRQARVISCHTRVKFANSRWAKPGENSEWKICKVTEITNLGHFKIQVQFPSRVNGLGPGLGCAEFCWVSLDRNWPEWPPVSRKLTHVRFPGPDTGQTCVTKEATERCLAVETFTSQ
jgi:hypothetical protein